jgi:hypothetical protein
MWRRTPRYRDRSRSGCWRAKNRVYAAINIGGLALGLAGCLLILGYVRYERSYDSWLPGRSAAPSSPTGLCST